MHRHSAARVQERTGAPEGGPAERDEDGAKTPARRPALQLATTASEPEDREDRSACAAHWAY